MRLLEAHGILLSARQSQETQRACVQYARLCTRQNALGGLDAMLRMIVRGSG